MIGSESIFILGVIILIFVVNLNRKTDKNMANLKDRFDAVDASLTEASTELTTELQKLRDELSNASTALSPEAEASLASIEAKAKALADIVPNAPSA